MDWDFQKLIDNLIELIYLEKQLKNIRKAQEEQLDEINKIDTIPNIRLLQHAQYISLKNQEVSIESQKYVIILSINLNL